MESGQFGQYQAVSKLYKEIVDAVTTLELGQVKLFLVNLQKRIEAKEAVLEEYRSVRELLDGLKEAKGKVTLHYASARGDVDVVRHLVEAIGVDFRIKDKEGSTPFFTAIENNHLQLVRYFIEELKCSANQTKQDQIGALHLATNHGNLDVMEYLIMKGADIEKISIYGKPLNIAVVSGSIQGIQLLFKKGVNPNGDSSGSSVAPLIMAVDIGNQKIYQLLLEKGADINVKDPSGYSVLHLAAEKGQLHFVKDLVQRGASLNEEINGATPLYLAFQHSKWDVVSYLRDKMPNHEVIEVKWKEENQKVNKDKVEPDKARAEEIKNSGNKYYAAKQYEQALSEYTKALTFDETNDVIHRNTAACYLPLKQFEKALWHCKKAKEVDPKNIKTIYRESQSYQGLGNLLDAASSMWECCMLEPHNNMFRAQFQKIVQDAKTKHSQEHKNKEKK